MIDRFGTFGSRLWCGSSRVTWGCKRLPFCEMSNFPISIRLANSANFPAIPNQKPISSPPALHGAENGCGTVRSWETLRKGLPVNCIDDWTGGYGTERDGRLWRIFDFALYARERPSVPRLLRCKRGLKILHLPVSEGATARHGGRLCYYLSKTGKTKEFPFAAKDKVALNGSLATYNTHLPRNSGGEMEKQALGNSGFLPLRDGLGARARFTRRRRIWKRYSHIGIGNVYMEHKY